MTSKRHGLRILPFLLVALACGDDPSGPGPDPDPPTLEEATITPVAANVNSAVVAISATGADAARLRLRTDGEPDELSPPYPLVDGATEASALGMLAGREYAIDVLLLDGTDTDSVATLAFTAGPLPDWIPDIDAAGTPSGGLTGLALPEGGVVVDGQGRVRWYLTSSDPVLNNFMAHPSGEYTLFGTEDAVRLYKVFDELGREIRQIGCAGGRETRFHEIRVMSGGDYWAMCDETILTDLSDRGGTVDEPVIWTVIQHLDADGVLLAEFRTSEHFSLDDIDPDVIDGSVAVNMTHGNAIDFDTDGGLLLSWRSLNEITKVDVESDEVVWRLGGRANQFLIDDPTRAFERQHGLRLAGPGVLQLLDNGTAAPSRMIRYEIDEDAMTAELVLEYAHASNALSLVGGSTDVLDGGAGLVSIGRAGRVAEVDASGEQTWELTGLEDRYVFRAFRMPSLYASERLGD